MPMSNRQLAELVERARAKHRADASLETAAPRERIAGTLTLKPKAPPLQTEVEAPAL